MKINYFFKNISYRMEHFERTSLLVTIGLIKFK
jgi:hypothetical protein